MATVCPKCGIRIDNPYNSACPSCNMAFSNFDSGHGRSQPERRSHPTAIIGLFLGLLANLIVVVATLIAMPALVASANGQEVDDSTAIAFGLGLLGVGFVALVGFVLSIIGLTMSPKKLWGIIGILVCLCPPVTYIGTCVILGLYLGATGQV